ncbi:MAG TPA: ABC transporter ATP-binding protein [Chloroflexota bacterium]|jgi:putative ABC transport system ATP-binding protein|nr:ABC transporter ATP-binding protein [Chloroflexota bacterium]
MIGPFTKPSETANGTRSGEEIVRVENVQRIYQLGHEQVTALRGINLSVRAGELAGLMGRSGSGKTTLLNMIGGLDKPTHGKIYIRGQDLSTLPDGELTALRRATIGYVFQSFALIPVLSAFENVELPMHIAGVPRKERQKRATELLQLVGLAKRMHHRPFELSGGEQQRVAIARALGNRPSLMLADEPTGELDSTTGFQIMTLFRYIATNENVAVIICTHDPTITQIAHVTYEISDGLINQLETSPVSMDGQP